MPEPQVYTCSICGRTGLKESFEWHHLYPVKTRRKDDSKILVDTQCGDQIHLMFTNQRLQKDLHTLADLRLAMASYIEWVQDKPIETHFAMAKKKRHN